MLDKQQAKQADALKTCSCLAVALWASEVLNSPLGVPAVDQAMSCFEGISQGMLSIGLASEMVQWLKRIKHTLHHYCRDFYGPKVRVCVTSCEAFHVGQS